MTKRSPSGRPQPLRNSVKKPLDSQHGLIEKKANDISHMTKGRKLFNATSPFTRSEQEKNLCSKLVVESMQDIITSNAATDVNASNEDDIVLPASHHFIQEEDTCVSCAANGVEPFTAEVDVRPVNEYKYLQDNAFELEPDSRLSADQQGSSMMEDNQNPFINGMESSPPVSERLREISNSLKLLSSQPIRTTPKVDASSSREISMDHTEPNTPGVPLHLRFEDKSGFDTGTPQDIFKAQSTGIKKSLVQECLTFLNSANKEELKKLKGIGEKRAEYILQLRQEDPEPFKDIEELQDLGLSSKQIKQLMTSALGEF